MNKSEGPPSNTVGGRLGWMLPGLAMLRGYRREFWKRDALSAAVVALVLIPSALAYAELARCAPVAGLFAAVGSMVVFAFFTTSRHLMVGPDAAIALLVGAVIGPLAAEDLGKAVTLSAFLSFLTGGILLLMARLRLGVAADFLSSPAMSGFMNGAAVVIIGSQIGKLCGIRLTSTNTLFSFGEWASRLDEIQTATLLVGLFGLAVLALCRWGPWRVPGALVVFMLAMIVGCFVDFSALGLSTIGSVELRVPDAVRPHLALKEAAPLFTAALGAALLVFSEGVVLARSVAKRHHYDIDPDRELIAFGAANIAVALFGSFAVGGSQTRTLLNDATGGCTQMVSLLAAGMVAGFVLLCAPWIATIPSVAIAAILIFTAVTLFDAGLYSRLHRLDRFSMIVAAATTGGVIVLGVLPGILLGVVLSLLGVLARIVRPQDALLGCVEGDVTLHDIGDDAAARTIPGLVVYRFYGPLIFANVRFFIERIESFIAKEAVPVREIILDARAIPSIDLTAAEQLRDYVESLHERGITLVIAKAHLPLREMLAALEGNFLNGCEQFGQLADAVTAFQTARRSNQTP